MLKMQGEDLFIYLFSISGNGSPMSIFQLSHPPPLGKNPKKLNFKKSVKIKSNSERMLSLLVLLIHVCVVFITVCCILKVGV